VVGEGAAPAEVHAQDVEGARGPADADADDEAAAAEPVDGGGGTGERDRVAVGGDEDARAETDGLGLPGQPGEGGEALVERGG
jgi:hypothetical protein